MELKLQVEVSELKRNRRLLELERELEVKKYEVEELSKRIGILESEKSVLCEQVAKMCLNSKKKHAEILKREDKESSMGNMEMEVVELRRLNKELHMEKRNLSCKLSLVETQLASVAKAAEVVSFFLFLSLYGALSY